jgi:hypothetical protein
VCRATTQTNFSSSTAAHERPIHRRFVDRLIDCYYTFSFLSHLPIPDDPYYCGMRARVPNFVKANKAKRIVDSNSNYISSNNLSKLMKEKEKEMKKMAPAPVGVAPLSTYHQHHGNNNLYHHHLQSPHHQPQQYSMWHAKSYESGIGKIFTFVFRAAHRALTSHRPLVCLC